MNITRKTFYGIGILSAALNILGGAMLLFSIRADLVFNIATVAAGVMMLMLATNLKEDPRGRNFCLAAALLTVLGMVPGIVGIVCAAASWPVFAWPYFKASVPENGLHKAAFLVMVCGLVLLVGSFLPVPQMPVSYTHLDVYKRQITSTTARWMGSCRASSSPWAPLAAPCTV